MRSHAQFLVDLENSVAEIKAHPELSSQLAGVYGMVSAIPDKSIVDEFLVKLLGELFVQGNTPSIIEENKRSGGDTYSAKSIRRIGST